MVVRIAGGLEGSDVGTGRDRGEYSFKSKSTLPHRTDLTPAQLSLSSFDSPSSLSFLDFLSPFLLSLHKPTFALPISC